VRIRPSTRESGRVSTDQCTSVGAPNAIFVSPYFLDIARAHAYRSIPIHAEVDPHSPQKHAGGGCGRRRHGAYAVRKGAGEYSAVLWVSGYASARTMSVCQRREASTAASVRSQFNTFRSGTRCLTGPTRSYENSFVSCKIEGIRLALAYVYRLGDPQTKRHSVKIWRWLQLNAPQYGSMGSR